MEQDKGSKAKESQLKANVSQLPVTVQLGKRGITAAGVQGIRKQLKKRGIVKVRLLRGFREQQKQAPTASKKDVAEQLAKAADAELISLVGFTLVLQEKKARKTKQVYKTKKHIYK